MTMILLNGRRLGPDEYSINRETGVVTLREAKTCGRVQIESEMLAIPASFGRARKKAQWKGELNGGKGRR
jgi:hypothetical protein